ncbi:MAG: ABC transporter substrate-binding protein [Methylovirgula sp.]|uniref:ABC transporter substrate-binding protein n=1 Tax=Methylovirgula sp. TaxID=1978224 RepID=UPI0030761829
MMRTKIATKVFPGPQNIGLFTAEALGLFVRRGIDANIQITIGSDEQRDSLRDGATQVIHSAVDNAVYMKAIDGIDIVIVAGGGTGMNDLIARPEIQSYEDIRGKTVVVDAAMTAYAFLLYSILAKHGLERGSYNVLPLGGAPQRLRAMQENPDYVAAMLNPPCSLQAQAEGYRSFGSAVSILGPYQGDGVFALRNWAESHSGTLVQYLAAFVDGTRWALAAENHIAATEILQGRLNLTPGIAALSLKTALGQNGGLAPDARLDLEGFKNTLAIRESVVGTWQGAVPEATSFLDMNYYDRAILELGARP